MTQSETTGEPGCCGVVIVGGGCSGLLVAVHLLRIGYPGGVTIVEPRCKLGRGLAYSTPFDEHLLNVPAAKMSALPDAPDHFLKWLTAKNWPGAAPDSFAPRRVYGEYLEDVLQAEIQTGLNRNFRHIRAEVVDIDRDGGGARLALSDNSTIRAERVVLALGNPASCRPLDIPMRGLEDRWHASPWLGDALRVRFAGERILLLGTGLTAVDAVLALQSQGAGCETHMISRRGILPHVHNPRLRTAMPPVLLQRSSLRLMFRELRAQIGTLRDQDLCWRLAIDSLRPVSNQIWQDLPMSDRKTFQRHLRTYWETHRHRMAPEVRQRMDRYRAENRVRVFAGRLREASQREHAIEARIALRGAGERVVEVDRIISCVGIQEDYANSPRSLIHSLIQKGQASANDLGMGFRTDRHGALVDATARPSPVIFTLGPPLRGELFETTAVPEIRVQAEALAQRLAGPRYNYNLIRREG
jgi:uncharacterized NAD(P)/FAD-binding protein YdhS